MNFNRKKAIPLLFLALFFAACGGQNFNRNADESAVKNTATPNEVPEKYKNLIKNLEPFFEPMGAPEADEWLANFKENGQTFEEYINQNPTLPTNDRNVLYVQPLGEFSPQQLKTIKTASEFMSLFFNLRAEILPVEKFNKPLSVKHSRRNPFTKHEQVRTGYILDELLRPKLPKDAAALIAFTNEDLYPDQTFNYLFGQASFENRVGIWSLYRLNDDKNDLNFLKRTLKIAVHETGHMFSMRHCTKYECVMSGTNHIGETDKRPLDACPECTAKIIWMNKINAVERYEKLAEYSKKIGLIEESRTFTQKAAAIQ